jgi:hypothetical protein
MSYSVVDISTVNYIINSENQTSTGVSYKCTRRKCVCYVVSNFDIREQEEVRCLYTAYILLLFFNGLKNWIAQNVSLHTI